MKKLCLLFTVALALMVQTTWAQTDTEPVNFTAILSDVFALNVTGGQDQTATFNTPLAYNGGVWEGAGIASGFTTVTMESTDNWNLQISSPDFADGGGQAIPINNLGVWVEATGTHQIGVEVLCTNVSAATSLGLSNAVQLLIDNNTAGAGNAGDASDNAFTLHWRMGTMDNASMNTASMFDQMSAGDFGPGTYTTIVSLIMNAIP